MLKYLIVVCALLLSACSADSAIEEAEQAARVVVLAEGLQGPVGLAQQADGSTLIAEEGSGEGDNSGRISLLTSDGRFGPVISGFSSDKDSGDLAGVVMVAVSPDESTLYVGHFGSESLLTLDLESSELVPGQPFSVEDLGISMAPLNDVRLINPFDLAFESDGRPVVSDSSSNGLATETADGKTQFFHRFGQIQVSETLFVEPVPTGIERSGEEFLVTLLGGCPFPNESGKLVAVDQDRAQRDILTGLNNPIDVASGPDGQIWLAEFASFTPGASCFDGTGYEAGTGSISRVVGEPGSETLESVVSGLDFPGALLPLDDGTLLVTEVFSGRLLQILPDAGQGPRQAQREVLGEVTEDSSAPWRLENVAQQVGLDFEQSAFRSGLSMDPVAAMGGGLCWVDFDRDGWLDLYLLDSFSEADQLEAGFSRDVPRNALFKNEQGRFVDVSADSGADLSMRANGCVVADFDDDGWDDLFVTAAGPNALLLNRADGTFVDVAEAAGVASSEWNSGAAAADVDGDGRIDLFVAAYIDPAVTVAKPVGAFPQDFPGLPDVLYMNMGLNSAGEPLFEAQDLGNSTGIVGRGLGATFFDADADSDLDLYVANDGNPNQLFRNDGSGSFTEISTASETDDAGSGMGIAVGDIDGDEAFDLIVTNWDRELHALYQNGGDSLSDQIGFQYLTGRISHQGLGRGTTGWGVEWSDLDNDSDLDLVIANGHVPITDMAGDAQNVFVFLNLFQETDAFQIRDISESVGAIAAGTHNGRGLAAADFDNDGDVDLAVNVIGGPPLLLRNEDPVGRSITVDLGGSRPGTVVEVELLDGRVIRRDSRSGGSYLSSSDPRLHFGIGDADSVASVTIEWPNGVTTTMVDVLANTTLTPQRE